MYNLRATTDELKQKVLVLVEENSIPVSVEFVARKLDVSWGTARNLLLELALQGEIRAEKTMKSWIFRPIETKEG